MNGNTMKLIVPWVIVFMALGYLFVQMSPRDETRGMRVQSFGKIPVQDGGRIKPIDTVARATLLSISNKQTYKDSDDKTQPAIKFLLALMSQDESVKNWKIFRIENDQLLGILELEPRSGFRYAQSEISVEKLNRQVNISGAKSRANQDAFDRQVLDLAEKIDTVDRFRDYSSPAVLPLDLDGKDWAPIAIYRGRMKELEKAPLALAWFEIYGAYHKGDEGVFNDRVDVMNRLLEEHLPAVTKTARFEAFFNHFAPFYECIILYCFVFVLSALSWLVWRETLNRAAFLLAVLTLVVHTWALFARMYLMDRPFVFVTNLYSSAIFIGWGCVLTGLILELIYHNGFGNVVAGITGALSLLIANGITLSGQDTLGMLEAVLDTNFWLATHVTSVTIGYTATFVAGFIAILFLLRGVVTTSFPPDDVKEMSNMIYGVACFAMLFSFLGTVLGGIWADQSWGRFWGWDPKENGAVLIVIWNALILHARWGGLVKARGLAVLAVVGNMVTAWSWFGTNQLGVGLHAYGFSKDLADGLRWFWISQMVIIGLGLLPERYWRSHRVEGRPTTLDFPRAPGKKLEPLGSS